MNYKEYIHGYMEWAAGGLAGASLALFIFVPTLSNIRSDLQSYSTFAFVAALPFLTFVSALSKEIRYLERSSSKTHNYQGLMIAIGLMSFLLGLVTLCWAINFNLMACFLVAVLVALLLYARASRALENPKIRGKKTR